MRYWEMKPNLFYSCAKHIFMYDGKNYYRRPFDVWSEKYLDKWEKLDILEIEPLDLKPIKPGTKLPLMRGSK